MMRIIFGVAFVLSTIANAFAATTDGNQDAPSSTGLRSDKRDFSLAETGNTFFKSFKELGLSLGKSASSVEEEGLPAELGFTDDIDKSVDYHADFFLKWVPKTSVFGEMLFTPTASVEGHVSSADKTTTDAWRFRAGLEYDTPLFGSRPKHENPVTHHVIDAPSSNWLHLDANFKYEASRDFNVTKTMCELELTPDIPSLFIGVTAYHYHIDQQGRQTGREMSREDVKNNAPPIDFRWRPFLDFDAGATTDDGTTAGTTTTPVEKHDAVLRMRPRLHADLWLNFLSRALGFKTARLHADYEHAFLPLQSTSANHNYLETGAIFGFTENVGFNLTYTVGEQSPEFKHEQKLVGALTVGF